MELITLIWNDLQVYWAALSNIDQMQFVCLGMIGLVMVMGAGVSHHTHDKYTGFPK